MDIQQFSTEPRAPASSPIPAEYCDLDVDRETVLDDDEASFLLSFAESLEEEKQSEDGGIENDSARVGMSEAELAFQKWLMFANSAKAQEAMNNTSAEFRLIRDQIMEELEWQKQGLFTNEDGRAWMADRDEELKRLRLKLAAKRGWEAIRRKIQEMKDDKNHQMAQENWRNMFRVAKEVATVEDKVRLDLYERYGFLGWNKNAMPPFNPMFPERNYKISRERATILHQLSCEQEAAEEVERAKSQLQLRSNSRDMSNNKTVQRPERLTKSSIPTSRAQHSAAPAAPARMTTTRSPRAGSSNAHNDTSFSSFSLPPINTNGVSSSDRSNSVVSGNNVIPGYSRAVTMLSVPSSSFITTNQQSRLSLSANIPQYPLFRDQGFPSSQGQNNERAKSTKSVKIMAPTSSNYSGFSTSRS